MVLGFADAVTPAAPSAPSTGVEVERQDEPALRRDDMAQAFDTLSRSSSPEPDLDLSFTVGGTPLGGDVRAGGGALILPGREASGTASAGFARVRPTVTIHVEPPAAAPLDAATQPATWRPDAAAALSAAPAVSAAPSASDADTASHRDTSTASADTEPEGPAAPLGPRMLAGLVDLAVLAAVDAAVVLATLRATGIDIADVQRLPLAPLGVFLALLAVGYLSMSTVLAGRTFGKAAFGLAVVEAGGSPVRLAPAVVRALIQVITVPAAGIGFLPALLGADRRSLYDRLAGTDVVRASRTAEDTRAQ
jgi:uncharacterized RDD family membrane protein YckC